MKFYLRKFDNTHIGTVDDGSTLEEVLAQIKKAKRTWSIKDHGTFTIITIF